MENEVITSKKIIYPGDMIGIIGEGRSSVQLVTTAKSMGFKVSVYVTSEQMKWFTMRIKVSWEA